MNKTGIQSDLLIIGIGNSLMGDDGIGAYVAGQLEHMQLPGVKTMQVQQMTTDLLDDMLTVTHTLIVDAAVEAAPVVLYKVEETAPAGASYSHYTSAVQLLRLADLVYGKKIALSVCAVGAWDLTLGDTLSIQGKKNADKAVSTILGWLNGRMY